MNCNKFVKVNLLFWNWYLSLNHSAQKQIRISVIKLLNKKTGAALKRKKTRQHDVNKWDSMMIPSGQHNEIKWAA